MTKALKSFLFLACLCLVASCSKEQFSRNAIVGDYVTFNATVDDAASKTFLDGVQVKWSAADEINVWYGTINTEMKGCRYSVGSIDGTDARKATFNGFAAPSDAYMAVYPYSESNECSKKGKLTVTVPTVQEPAPGGFAPGANVAVAYSTTTGLSFQNVGGLLAVKVVSTGGHTVKTIRLTGTSAMSGEVEIKQADLPDVSDVTEGVNHIVLDCGDGINIIAPATVGSAESFIEAPGSWDGDPAASGSSPDPSHGPSKSAYYLVSLPGSHTSFVLTFVDNEGKTARLQQTVGLTIARNSNTLLASVAAPSEASKWKTDPSGLYINEIFCHEDRIELWNSNDFAIDLSGWLLVKDEYSWAFPNGSSIDAGSYKVVTAGQTDCALGPTFGLSGDKGFVLSLVNGTVVDCIDNSGEGKKVIGTTETYGRRTDGSAEWVVFSSGTIYEDGVCDGDNSKGTVKESPVSSAVVLNEVNGNGKYVELHNTGAQSADITGWTLEKDGKTVWTASDVSQCTLAAGAYLAIDFVKKSTDPKEAASGISAGKSVKVELKDAGGNSVDVFTRGEEGSGWGDISLPEHEEWSFNRVPDGSGDWKYALPTKGAANGAKTGTIEQYPAANGVVLLNELNGNDKFIELYSTATDEKISLEDCTICKDDGTTPIWTGAPGLALAPGEHLLLYSEDKKTPETYDARLIFSSGLSAKKTLKIELLSADGGTSMDVFTRGSAPWGTTISSCDKSFGRTPDGTGLWKLTDATPGTANGESQGDIPQS